MSAASALILVAWGLSLAMALAWLLARRTGNHGFVDTIWSLATGLAGVAAVLLPSTDGWPPRQAMVAALVSLWSLRLGGHILRRTLEGKGDPRYRELERQWGDSAAWRLFLFLQIQALAGLILVCAVMAAAHAPWSSWRLADLIGVLIALAAILGETVADRQLARFRRDPAHRGRVCDTGLWGLSRHPNYFFEWLGWLAFPAIAIDPGAAYPAGYAALAAPVLIYLLLVHASGIPPTEAHMLRSRGAAFRDYQRRVNAFWPGPARR